MSSLYQSMIAVIEQSITPLAGRLGQQNTLSLSAMASLPPCRL
ncbi:PTS system protein [Klebsiella pneumoniae]|uniref:PTS system protein n=1 Tax=Klebsiella pneumoniae TaxID=573 RepID=A0A377TH26_KLEPN|nr:PTS system protein [Klebsiella pneumoniae]